MGEYEAGALAAWTPAQQAALNVERYQKQLNQDLIESKREEEREARAKVKQGLQRARETGDDKAKARFKREQERLDKRYGPEQAFKQRGDKMVAVWDWADEATAVGRLKGEEKEAKKKREEGYGQAVSLSAGQIVDNLASRTGIIILTPCDVPLKELTVGTSTRLIRVRSSRGTPLSTPF